MDLNKFFEKILNELSYRVKEGLPDLTNKSHLETLKQIMLEETDYDYTLVEQIMNNLNGKKLKSIPVLISEAEKKGAAPAPAPEPAADDKGEETPAPAADDKGEETPAPAADDKGGEDAPAPEPAADDKGGEDAPTPDAGGEDAPAPAAADSEETPAEEEPKEEKPEEKKTDDSAKTGNTSSQATINMQNAEKSGVYFNRPATQYAAAPAVEAVYEHPNGTLFMKVGDAEFQINLDPYTGYKAPIKLNPLEKQSAKETGEYIKVAPNHKTDVKPAGKESGEEAAPAP